MCALASKEPGAETALAAALRTRGGQKAYPKLAQPGLDEKRNRVIVGALAGALGNLGTAAQPSLGDSDLALVFNSDSFLALVLGRALPVPPAGVLAGHGRGRGDGGGQLVSTGDNLDASVTSSSCSSVSGQTVKVGKPLPKAAAQPAPLPPVPGTEVKGERVRESKSTSNSVVKMPLVTLIMAHAEGEVGTAEMARALGLNLDYVRKACSRPNVQARDGVEQPGVLVLKQLGAREGTIKTHVLMQELIVDFFTENTSLFSGARRKTRRLLMSRTELLQRFFALLPQLLRAKAASHPELARAGHLAKQYTRLQANTLAALWAAERKGFGELCEVEERLAAAKKHDLDKLVANAWLRWASALRLCSSLREQSWTGPWRASTPAAGP